MGEQWYYLKSGKQTGPVSGAELQQLASSGALLATDMVWRHGMPTWLPAEKLKGLFAGTAAPTAPPFAIEHPGPGAPAAAPSSSGILRLVLLVGGGCFAAGILLGVLLAFKATPITTGATSTTTGATSTIGPSKFQVLRDWEYLTRVLDCSKDVRFKKVEVLGTSVSGNQAEVLVRVTGEWIGGANPGYFEHMPCAGFMAQAGKSQFVVRQFIYKKYDTGWRLEGNNLIQMAMP
jgi:hypothetical protein